jgi:hypothetical protein
LTAFRNDATIQLNAIRTDTTMLVNRRADSLESLTTSLFDKTDKRIASIEKNAFNLTTDLNTQISGLNTTLNNQLTAFNGNLNNQLTVFNANTNAQQTVLNGNIATLINTYSVFPSQIAARFDTQTDCSKNSLCWQNLTTDVLTNFRFTGRDMSTASQTFSAGFPILMTGFNQSVENLSAITGNFKKLTTPHWYDRVLGYVANGALIWSRLNPVTTLTVTGFGLLTAQK